VEEAPSTARSEGTPGGDRTGLKVAVFTPYLPYPPDTGGKIRSYYLLRALTARFDVDLYTVHYGQGPAEEDIEALEEHCRRVVTFRLEKKQRPRHRVWRALVPTPRAVDYFHTADSLAEAQEYLEAGEYDAIVIDEMCMTPYGELVEGVPRLVTLQKVDYAHYQEVAQARPWGLEKILDHIEARQIRQYGREKMPLYSAYLACSQQDVDKIRQDTPNIPALVIANGVDLAEFVPSDDNKAEKPTLLYVGSMNYYPNIDAMEFFFEEMYEPLMRRVPDVQMKIVGHAPPPEIERLGRLPNVEVTGSVPDVQPYYDEATVFVVPLRLGGGTRLKILEAMAMELPVVSTSVGAEGLNIHPGEDILIADDAETFVESTIRLLSDPDLYARIKAGGRRLAEEYDWLEICAPWADLVQEVAEKANV
jgi:sugar transferase (PEP-CTERM/EpsH1 system associated)